MGQISELAKQLAYQAELLKGEVMIYELSQTVQTFLLAHNKPPSLSFYDEMKRENFKREQDRMNEAKELKAQERQVLMDQVLKIREQYKNEPRLRRDTRRSVSESSSKRTQSSSENSDSSPLYKVHSKKDCSEHRRSDTLYFPNIGRKIQKGSCLGHSVRGCVFYSGIDLETGQLLYITEWNVKYTELETKCLPNCLLNRSLTEQKCTGHTADEIIAYIEKQVNR
jgi:eukaryotic translation initiation factor 2-alpha kinase 4